MVPDSDSKTSLPEPLRGAETGTFTEYSIVKRLPDIAARTLAENDFPAEVSARIEELRREIPDAPIQPVDAEGAPDAADWKRYIALYRGQNWLEVPWFFVEMYFYQRILAAMGYFGDGPLAGVDPFVDQKRQGLVTMDGAIRALSAQLTGWLEGGAWDADALRRVISVALWGNQADQSLWPADEANQRGHVDEGEKAHRILADDREAVIGYVMEIRQDAARIDLVADNAGFEFVCDLTLADYAVSAGGAVVHLHLKPYPFYVSDAMIKDFHETVAHLAGSEDAHVCAFGKRLGDHVEAGRLVLHDDTFWTSPLAMWALPRRLQDEFMESELVITKGDLNYRRLLGDRHWPFTMPFTAVVDYFAAPLLALRTCKSEVIVGLEPGQPDAAAEEDPDWLVNGQWGVIQFAP
jgi:uncharacterized protein with ATP-grasp and redox domains